jgi:phenylpropionate dioxygenase-like ring-hydroxylating dioxygenase large terminal subunit
MKAYHEDRWIAVGLDAQIEPASAHPVVVDGHGLAVWRGENGEAHVWEDRCPHRGMRLSFGFVRDNHLTCLYHGWTYGADAQCSKIPAHPDLTPPRTICAHSYAGKSARGIIFANLAEAPAAALPNGAGEWYPVRSLFVAAAPVEVRRCFENEDTPFGRLEHGAAADVYEAALAEGDRLTVALQPVEETKTALHLTTTAADLAGRLALARQAVRLRDSLERR